MAKLVVIVTLVAALLVFADATLYEGEYDIEPKNEEIVDKVLSQLKESMFTRLEFEGAENYEMNKEDPFWDDDVAIRDKYPSSGVLSSVSVHDVALEGIKFDFDSDP